MPVLNKPFYELDEVCARFGLEERDLHAFVLSGDLTLSATVAGLRVIHGSVEWIDVGDCVRVPDGRQHIIGTIDLLRDDAWTILRDGTKEITSLKAEKDRYIDIDAGWVGTYTVWRSDLVICRAELQRFAGEYLENSAEQERSESGPVRRGAPQKYDWDRFWVEVCRRVFEDGVPATQGEFVRLMLDWFGETGASVPDHSTVKKKLSPLWRQIAPREDEPPLEQRHRA